MPNELGITPVGIEVRCYPERISAFTLLRVCMIVLGPPSSGNLNSSSCTQRGKFLVFPGRNLVLASNLLGGMKTRHPTGWLCPALLGACMLRRWRGCARDGGAPCLTFYLWLSAPAEHALTHPGCYIVSLMDVASSNNIELTLSRFKPPWHQLIL